MEIIVLLCSESVECLEGNIEMKIYSCRLSIFKFVILHFTVSFFRNVLFICANAYSAITGELPKFENF